MRGIIKGDNQTRPGLLLDYSSIEGSSQPSLLSLADRIPAPFRRDGMEGRKPSYTHCTPQTFSHLGGGVHLHYAHIYHTAGSHTSSLGFPCLAPILWSGLIVKDRFELYTYFTKSHFHNTLEPAIHKAARPVVAMVKIFLDTVNARLRRSFSETGSSIGAGCRARNNTKEGEG